MTTETVKVKPHIDSSAHAVSSNSCVISIRKTLKQRLRVAGLSLTSHANIGLTCLTVAKSNSKALILGGRQGMFGIYAINAPNMEFRRKDLGYGYVFGAKELN